MTLLNISTRPFSLAVMLSALLVGGCMNTAEINDRVMQDQASADKALQAIEPKPYKREALVVDERPWFGATAVPMDNGQAFPPLLTQSDGVVMTFERPVTLSEAARMIQAATGIRVRGAHTVASGPGQRITGEEKTFIPPDGIEVTGGRVVWQGPLPVLLDQVADYFDAEWHYDGNAISLSNEVTKTFMLHALADSINFTGTIDSSTDNDTVLPKVGIESSATLAIWDEMQTTIDSIVGTAGRATYSPTTGTVTVTGTPSVVSRTEQYLREQNRLRLRRVAVAVKVLSVTTSNENSIGFNLSAILERAIGNKPFTFNAVGDGLTAGILRAMPSVDPVTGLPVTTGGTTPDNDMATAILEASEDIQRVSLSNSGAIVTLSDVPAPLQIGRTIAYLKRVSSSSSGDGTGNVSLEPGEVNVGLTMNVLPRVIQRDRILLRLAIGITDAPTPFREFGVGDDADGLRLELPEIATTGFLQNAVLAEGETLVLAGFEKNQNSLRDQGVPGGLMTGGTRTANKSREATVLLISSEVLPEEPLTVIGGDS
jgi:type IVB pilus formation R64 PilN family outer membrane protein